MTADQPFFFQSTDQHVLRNSCIMRAVCLSLWAKEDLYGLSKLIVAEKKVALFPLRLCYRTTIGACDSGPNRRMRSGENEPCTFSGTWRLLDALRQMAGRARHSWPPRDLGRFVDRNRPETLCRMSFSISSEQWRILMRARAGVPTEKFGTSAAI